MYTNKETTVRELSSGEIEIVSGGSAHCAAMGMSGAVLGARIGSILGPWGMVAGAIVGGAGVWAACEY